jgi:hypothetical protein
MKNFQNKAKIVKVSKVIRAILYAGMALWIFAFFREDHNFTRFKLTCGAARP